MCMASIRWISFVLAMPEGSVFGSHAFVLSNCSHLFIQSYEMFDLLENILFAFACDSTLLAVVREPADRPDVVASVNRHSRFVSGAISCACFWIFARPRLGGEQVQDCMVTFPLMTWFIWFSYIHQPKSWYPQCNYVRFGCQLSFEAQVFFFVSHVTKEFVNWGWCVPFLQTLLCCLVTTPSSSLFQIWFLCLRITFALLLDLVCCTKFIATRGTVCIAWVAQGLSKRRLLLQLSQLIHIFCLDMLVCRMISRVLRLFLPRWKDLRKPPIVSCLAEHISLFSVEQMVIVFFSAMCKRIFLLNLAYFIRWFISLVYFPWPSPQWWPSD